MNDIIWESSDKNNDIRLRKLSKDKFFFGLYGFGKEVSREDLYNLSGILDREFQEDIINKILEAYERGNEM